jgi:hypothetical protein
VKFRAEIGDDASFYSSRNRKILKAEMVFEHQEAILKSINRKFEPEEYDLIDINVNLFRVKIDFQTRATCFTGWDRKGLKNHIGRLIVLKNLVFNLY